MRGAFGPLSLVGALALGVATRAQAEQPSSANAHAEAEATARNLFEKGLALYRNRKYRDAIDAFLAADRIFPNPVLSFNAARAYDDLHDTAGALRFYRSYLRQAAQAPDRPEGAARIGELERALIVKGIQQVTVISEPGAATVMLDGQPVGLTPWTAQIPPGKHRLKLSREGYRDTPSEFDLPSDHALDVEVKLANEPLEAAKQQSPSPSTPISREPTFAAPGDTRVGPVTFAALGVGAAGLAGALVFEVMRASSEQGARNEPTQIGRADKIDEEKSRQTTSRILVAVGAAGALAGGVLLYVDLSSAISKKKQVGVLAGGCGSNGCGLSLRGALP